jgi:hypothetical protein
VGVPAPRRAACTRDASSIRAPGMGAEQKVKAMHDTS